MQTPDDSGTPPSHATLIIAAMGLLGFGLVMLLHGFSLISADALRPNPLAPRWVFGVIGAILVLAAILMAAKVKPLPARVINTAGYSILGLSWIMAHWLVFFSEGGSCEAGSGGFLLNLPALACRGIFGAVVIFFDLILLTAAYATLRPSRRV